MQPSSVEKLQLYYLQGFLGVFGKPRRAAESKYLEVTFQKETQ